MVEALASPRSSPNDPQQLGFALDLTRCSGCMACMVACMDENDLPGDRCFRQVIRSEQRLGTAAKITFVSLACSQCGHAPCGEVCPTGAIHKRAGDNIVIVDQDRCIGCHSCLAVCPFGAPQFLADGHMHKCHLCFHRLDHHLEPACVRICPTRALDFGPLAELSRQQAKRAGNQILSASLTASPETP